MKILSEEIVYPYIDEFLGADVIDLDNSTYFDTVKKLKRGERIEKW